MAYKNPDRMKQYMLERYHRRRKEAIEKLGGCCIKCGATKNLQLDHIDPKEKSFSVCKLWGVSKSRYEEEVSKCQILCRDCHIEKTIKERGHQSRKQHGTEASYRHAGCRCEACKEAHRERMKIYNQRRRGVAKR